MATGDHWGRSPQAVGHDRGRRPAREAARLGSVHHRPGRLRGDAEVREDLAATGSGRSRAPTAWAVRLAQRLLEAGEHVVDVPAKLAARARLLDTGHGRKTDAHDAHSIAVVAVRAKDLRVLGRRGARGAADARPTAAKPSPGGSRPSTGCTRCSPSSSPGQAKKDLTALQAKTMLASVRPRDIAGKTRRRIAAEELAELIAVETKIKTATAEIKAIVTDPWLPPDGPARRRPGRRRPDPGRRR